MVEMPWTCPACGHNNIDEWDACIYCGVKKYIKELQKEWEE